jgi:glycerol-3-phosphate dehydrogenase
MTAVEAVDVLVVGGGATGAGTLRDLARRGLRCLLVEKSDLGTGTSGRYHGLLHSGGRYVVEDAPAARECIAENRVLRRIAPACIEDTGGWFVATPDDPLDYAERFAAACVASGVPCEEVPVADLLRREPALNPAIRRAFRVPDASLEPWQLIEANIADARAHGSEVRPYHRIVAMERAGEEIATVDIVDERSGTVTRVAPRAVVSAAGAWAGIVAGMAGVQLAMSPGKGTMLVFNQRMTDTVVNRCHPPDDGDIMVPVHSVAILGTTEMTVDDPDVYGIGRDEVELLMVEGTKLFPDLRRMRLLRAYAGVRPLYKHEAPAASANAGGDDGRGISRTHVVIDHGERDGVANFVSIVGGKLTTYRLMAEEAANAVCAKLGVTVPCTTADAILPDQGDGRTYWLGHRLAEHEAHGGGDADLICECELVTRAMLDQFLDERWPCSLDDVRRGTRLGMGPCQGGFCTFRATGVVAERVGGSGEPTTTPTSPSAGLPPETVDRILLSFLAERYRGTRPIAWGRQLQELWLIAGLYAGVLGIAALVDQPATGAQPREVDRAVV